MHKTLGKYKELVRILIGEPERPEGGLLEFDPPLDVRMKTEKAIKIDAFMDDEEFEYFLDNEKSLRY
jgi:hypothetical protein